MHHHLLALLTLLQLLMMGCSRLCDAWWFDSSKRYAPYLKGRVVRGGASEVNSESALGASELHFPTRSSSSSSSSSTSAKRRRASDLIHELVERSGLDQEQVNSFESVELRRLILERTQDQIDEIQQLLAASDTSEVDPAEFPDPRRLLHYLAPKIPAIKHSPDAALRIQSARSDMDPGLAACVIGSVAHVCVLRDKALAHLKDTALTGGDSGKAKHNKSRGDKDESMSLQIVKERRFEQLFECLLCGVNVQMRMREYSQRQIDHDADAESIEDLLHEKQAQITEGLYVRDAARAAWGLAILGAHRVERLGGELVTDFLVALSLRMRELLLAHSQELSEGDIASHTQDVDGRILELSEELAEDAASAMWAFACVRAITGLKFAPLFEICCMILRQNPVQMRKRAQDAEKDLAAFSVGSSDVVERLAKSESDSSRNVGEEEVSRHVGGTAKERDTLLDLLPPTEVTEEKDTLLDFLSPNEVTDVLWALALHGSRSHEDSSREEIALSETAAAFREIACDRLVGWLQAELEHIWSAKARITDHDVQHIHEEVMTVNVVDAASILRSEHEAAESGGSTIVIEDMTVGDDSAERGLQVIDSGQVLSSEGHGENPFEVERERLAIFDKASKNKKHVHSRFAVTASQSSLLQIFLPHDLCSIAWAVTELHDSLQSSVTQIVIDIFYELGAESLRELEGRDLSNLAWTVAKAPRVVGSSGAVDSSLLLMTWIADAMAPPEGAECDGRSSLVRKLQPPELGRLVWAIATCYSALETSEYYSGSIQRLALAALDATMDNFSDFGSEDLARIAWGFLVLTRPGTLLDVPRASKALGMAIAAIKASLLDWENGTLPSKHEESFSSKYPFTFTSFFGQARFLAQLLDRHDESTEEVDDFGLSLLTKKSRLPLLKDLPLDPSTLCKITSAFVTLRIDCPFMITGGEIFSRVALRLMTSRSGRLLRECPMSDLVRLCEAIASENVRLGRERVSLFVRKLVQLFNSEWFTGHSSTLTSQETATLIWSLGELGVKHTLNAGDDVSSAHRRLQLTGHLPILDAIQIRSLSTTSAIKLVSGIVSTHLALSQPAYAVEILDILCDRMGYLDSMQLCRLAEVVSRLKNFVMDESEGSPVALSWTLETSNTSKVEHVSDTKQLDNATNHESDSRGSTDYSDVISACDKVLSALAQHAIHRTNTMTAEELRRLMAVYSLCPFRADELVAAVSGEIDARLEMLESRPYAEVDVESGLRSIASQAEFLLKSLNGGEPDSLGAAIRNGLSSFFRGESKQPEQGCYDSRDLDSSNAGEIQEILSSIIGISQHVSELSTLTHSSFNAVSRLKAQGATFELGRCKELVAHYKRIDFVSGKRQNRYVQEDKRTLAKQVLSRLLP